MSISLAPRSLHRTTRFMRCIALKAPLFHPLCELGDGSPVALYVRSLCVAVWVGWVWAVCASSTRSCSSKSRAVEGPARGGGSCTGKKGRGARPSRPLVVSRFAFIGFSSATFKVKKRTRKERRTDGQTDGETDGAWGRRGDRSGGQATSRWCVSCDGQLYLFRYKSTRSQVSDPRRRRL